MSYQIIQGDCLDTLPTLPAASVQCCVTSPPYFGLRDYGVKGQLGLEPTIGEYVAAMTAVFRGVARVLKPDGVLWLNLGDSYATDQKGGVKCKEGDKNFTNKGSLGIDKIKLDTGLPSKNLLGIPWRVAFALQDDGWILRSDIIWHKPNPMPESVTDRPNTQGRQRRLLGLALYLSMLYQDNQPPNTDQIEQTSSAATAAAMMDLMTAGTI
jgi:DNA modification methylase